MSNDDDQIDLGTPDLDESAQQQPTADDITPQHRAKMAVWFAVMVVVVLLICIGLYAWHPDKNGPILEIAKIGLLPLLSSIFTYYFTRK
ncbi:hypothetical protein [Piscirickettsia litoralis]|uniref:Uncharacterized protein n=1 Tax=Piscirickettsia litoralis TaxID=1891921 RepID=A0ABX3A083_9GAMM|nr:hypothetical protein [Piscirickettsia litoralis]ODN41033.1 hypothetical protein BGC07_18555 [Piscirickettsia litoralis]